MSTLSESPSPQAALLAQYLRRLRLPMMLREYPALSEAAARERLPYERILVLLAEREVAARDEYLVRQRLGQAKFPVLKDLDRFVFTETTVDEGQVRELATGSFLDAKRNAIFIGGTGTGKTHLCIGVASAVIRSRARGRFFNLVDLVNQLEHEKAAGRSGRLAETLLRYDVIVIDELGYLPFSQPGGQLLFHLISKLYENTSLLITTNLTFADWPQVFGDSTLS